MVQIAIWRAAHTLLRWQGEAAPHFATRQITELTMQGDQAWSESLAKIAVLRMGKPPGEAQH